jgi:hypothetical protein
MPSLRIAGLVGKARSNIQQLQITNYQLPITYETFSLPNF